MTGNSWKFWGDAYGYNPEVHGFLVSLGFTDSSYGNDAAPSFHHHDARLRLWIEAVEPENRECQGARLALVEMDEDMEFVQDIFATDSWEAMAKELRKMLRPQNLLS